MWRRLDHISEEEAAELISKWHYNREIKRLEECVEMPAFDGMKSKEKFDQERKKLQEMLNEQSREEIDGLNSLLNIEFQGKNIDVND